MPGPVDPFDRQLTMGRKNQCHEHTSQQVIGEMISTANGLATLGQATAMVGPLIVPVAITNISS